MTGPLAVRDGEQPLPHAHSSPPTPSVESQGKPLIQGEAEIAWALLLLQWGLPFLPYNRSIPLAPLSRPGTW